MTEQSPQIAEWVRQTIDELAAAASLRAGSKLVMGVSTSEVQGQRIGTAGAESVATQIYAGVEQAAKQHGLYVVWQCCEHLNRALVSERSLAESQGWTVVSAVPVPGAGGAMAAYAYRQIADPCLVEQAQVHAGVDIGETMIGMHMRPVAVPFRPTVRWIGEARVTAAYSRPKLIGGERAVYARPVGIVSNDTCK